MRAPDPVTEHTAKAHQDACCNPISDWQDRRDFEFASRGLIWRPDDPGIYNQDGEIIWHHAKFGAFLHGKAPKTVHPSVWRHVFLNNYRGLFKVCDGIWQVRGESPSDATFIESKTGYICIDPLTPLKLRAMR